MSKRKIASWLAAVAAAIAGIILVSPGAKGGPGPLAAAVPREAPNGAPEPAPAPVPASAQDVRAEPGSDSAAAAAALRPQASVPARVAAPVKKWVRTPWGSEAGQLGRAELAEGSSKGPSAIALDASGRALVLDRVNKRIVRYDERGEPAGEIPTAVRVPTEVVAAQDGHLLVLDSTADRTVAVHDAEGKLVGELPVEVPGVEDAGEVTGMFVEGDSVYVETGHERLVRVGDTSGKPATEHPTFAGVPTRDGRALLRAALVDRASGRLKVRLLDRQTGEELVTRELSMGSPYQQILYLDSDVRGRVYVGVQAGSETSPGVWEGAEVRVACLTQRLDPIGLVGLPATDVPDDFHRDLAVADDGTLVYMHRTRAGVTVNKYACP